MCVPAGQGKTWTTHRVVSVRQVRAIHASKTADKEVNWLTMTEAAQALGATNHRMRRLIKAKVLPAKQNNFIWTRSASSLETGQWTD
jgi:hypothetical protein